MVLYIRLKTRNWNILRMCTFSFYATETIERNIQELIIYGYYFHRKEIFMECKRKHVCTSC